VTTHAAPANKLFYMALGTVHLIGNCLNEYGERWNDILFDATFEDVHLSWWKADPKGLEPGWLVTPPASVPAEEPQEPSPVDSQEVI
jgi:hypothetical protein